MLKLSARISHNLTGLPTDQGIDNPDVCRLNPFDFLRERYMPLILAALLLGSTPFGHAESEDGADDKDTARLEVAVTPPAPPLSENLLQFAGGPDASQSFWLDAKSLSISADGVIRYTLIAQSRSGARNISHEGLRCQSLEMKLYAFGHQDGSWSRPRRNQWQTISFRAPNRPQSVLAQDYFCQWGAVAGKAEDILARIRNKRPLTQ
jgi:hypothetical protein